MYVRMYCSHDSESTITSKRKRARCGQYIGCVEMKDCTTCEHDQIWGQGNCELHCDH